MESIQTFKDLVRKKIVEHEFKPICIEATMKLVNARNYEKTEKAKARHRKFRLTERGKECERERGKRYREKNKDNEEYKERRRATSRKCFRKKRTTALWMLLTYDKK